MAIRKKPRETKVYHYFNANPKDRRTCDCVIRAIATATGLTWEEVLRELTECAIKHHLMVNDPKLYEKYLKALGWKKMPAPRRSDNTRYTGYTFCISYLRDNHINGPIIAHIGGHHITTIIDKKVFDIWDCTDGSIGNYWILEDAQ